MENFKLAGKASTVFRLISIAAKRASMSECHFQLDMRCSDPGKNCWLCPIRQDKTIEALKARFEIEQLTLGVPGQTLILEPKHIPLPLVICPLWDKCDITECEHREQHLPFASRYGIEDCSNSKTICAHRAGHCEPYQPGD